jgi:hypothetical protein
MNVGTKTSRRRGNCTSTLGDLSRHAVLLSVRDYSASPPRCSSHSPPAGSPDASPSRQTRMAGAGRPEVGPSPHAISICRNPVDEG